MKTFTIATTLLLAASVGPAAAQRAPVAAAPATATPTVAPAAASLPEDYVIGPDDVLSIVFWRDKDMSGDVAVRPDGMISLPLINEVRAAGLTPGQLRDQLDVEARRFVDDPLVSVIVKQINSRKVFVTGQVMKPGSYVLTGPTTILQMIAIAGGLREDADDKHIVMMRMTNGRTVAFPFNYRDMPGRKNLQQNIALKSGDTIIVP